MNTLNLIEESCGALAGHRAQLRKKFEARQKAIIVATAGMDADIRDLQARCAFDRDVIIASLTAGRDLFSKPKTRTFAGITVGFEKERDAVTPPPEDVLVDRIEKMLPAKQAETVLDRSVSVIKAAFKKLPRELLQKLGCNIVAGADKPVVRADDDDIETLVQKSLGDAAGTTEVQS